MTHSRRDFVVTSLAGVARLYATAGHAQEQASPLLPEDGDKLWLRYAHSSDAAGAYRQAIRQLVVQGTSPPHAEGANVLADAVAPHGGYVIWRAFVYDEDVDADRAKRAYLEFTKLEGAFRPNVLTTRPCRRTARRRARTGPPPPTGTTRMTTSFPPPPPPPTCA